MQPPVCDVPTCVYMRVVKHMYTRGPISELQYTAVTTRDPCNMDSFTEESWSLPHALIVTTNTKDVSHRHYGRTAVARTCWINSSWVPGRPSEARSTPSPDVTVVPPAKHVTEHATTYVTEHVTNVPEVSKLHERLRAEELIAW